MTLRALPGIPRITVGDDLGQIIVDAVNADGHRLHEGDVIVVAQKIVSKVEDRVVRLNTVTPTPRAERLAELTGRDARLCQLYLDESKAVVEIIGRHVVTVDNRGMYDTAAGVDLSNSGVYEEGWACLLPVDPDASARTIRDRIRDLTGTTVAVIISDSLGNRWREGSEGQAIGLAGIAAVEKAAPDAMDLYGNPSWGDLNRVDELAGAAHALMGQTNEAIPVVLIRGAPYTMDEFASMHDLLVEVPLPEVDADIELTRPPKG